MRILRASFVLALGAAFVSIGMASVAHAADQCDSYLLPNGQPTQNWYKCEHDKTVVQGNDNNKVVCARSDASDPRGPCQKCANAFGAITPLTQWACGWPSANPPPDGYQTPPCYVGPYPTGRTPPDCSGTLDSNGLIK
jgi:hypothetical protein